MTIRELLGFADRIARQAEQASERFSAGLTIVARRTERELARVVEAAAEGASTAILRGRAAARAKVEIRHALEDAGYDDLIAQATGAPLDDVVQAVLALRQADRELALTDAFLQRVEALKALYETDLLEQGDALAAALWQATVRGIFGAQPVPAILRDLGEVIDGTEPQIRTLYDTYVSIFGRQVEALQAGNDSETLFLYLGPDDEKTRPFCQKHVGKVYARAEIDRMDNGQIDNVFMTGGGYNCRHSWIELAKSSELRYLHGTGERVPEVAQRMAA